jgi:hypothetical protein
MGEHAVVDGMPEEFGKGPWAHAFICGHARARPAIEEPCEEAARAVGVEAGGDALGQGMTCELIWPLAPSHGMLIVL